MTFGERIRELRRAKGLTLREVAERVAIDFTYLSKMETGKLLYTPSPEAIRRLASVLESDALELLRLADKLPPELDLVSRTPAARRFIARACDLAAPEDWEVLLDILEQRHTERSERRQGGEP